MRVRDLDEVPEDPVVTDTQGPDPGSIALARLQRSEVLAGVAPGRAEVVQVSVGARTDRTAIARAGREVIAEQRTQAVGEPVRRPAALGGLSKLSCRRERSSRRSRR